MANAVDLVRPIGSIFAVVPPQVLIVNVTLTVYFAAAQATTPGVSSIRNYIAIYLNSLPIGGTASVTRIAQNAYLAGEQVVNIPGIQLNGGSSDIVSAPLTVIKAGQVVVTTYER